jgi:RNA polymerase sigma factor (sigma-70 family)
VAGPTDAELLAAVATGSEVAFEELRRRYRLAVEGVCRAAVRGDAEDCAQEVFARIWQKAALFDSGRGGAAAWLLTLTRNVACNLRAQRTPETGLPEHVEDASAEPPSVDRFWVEAALQRLPPAERTALELAYFDDLSQSQIAEAVGAPLGSVKSWTRRGLNRLATLLGEESDL